MRGSDWKGRKNPSYNTKPGYGGIHTWLNSKFGRASRCENKICPKKSRWFEYALKKGKKYRRIRNHFIELCRPCHKRYDTYKRSDETKRKMAEAAKRVWIKRKTEGTHKYRRDIYGKFVKKT